MLYYDLCVTCLYDSEPLNPPLILTTYLPKIHLNIILGDALLVEQIAASNRFHKLNSDASVVCSTRTTFPTDRSVSFRILTIICGL
jgi:hypothetical protein